MTLTLHHLFASRSSRIVWLLEELRDAYGLEHALVTYTRDAVTNLAPPELLKVHPLGKAPVLEDDGAVIAESGAIAEYLMGRYDGDNRFHPSPDDPAFPVYLEWVHAAEGAPMLPGLIGFYLARSGLGDSPLAQYMASERTKGLAHVDAHLQKNTWFAGEAFSAADCLMGFMMQSAAMSGALSGHKGLSGWMARVAERPAYKRMLKIGV
jgi:glutathione S-transferase